MILSLINCGKTEIETSGTVSNSLVSVYYCLVQCKEEYSNKDFMVVYRN